MKCPKCQKIMVREGESITNNGKSGNEFKEYNKVVYWCKTDDIWIGIETPLDQDHGKYHSIDAFCGYAGSWEMEHLQELIAKLSDEELKQLVNNVGINFEVSEDDLERENYEGVIDEADREDFYMEYRKTINSRKKK